MSTASTQQARDRPGATTICGNGQLRRCKATGLRRPGAGRASRHRSCQQIAGSTHGVLVLVEVNREVLQPC